MRDKNENIDRMTRLESRVRILTFLVTALGLLLVTGAAQNITRSVQGREIDLVDASGRVRAAMKLKDGQPGIFYDTDGKVISRMPAEQQPVPSGQPKFDLDQYQFGLLERGPKWTPGSTPETKKIQEGHMANINSMAQAGKLVAAGPMVGDGDLRGIYVFKVGSVAEAEALAAKDPAIISGRLKLSFYNWLAPKGIGEKLLAELKTNPNLKYTMAHHYLIFLRKGPKWTETGSPELQNAHLWDIRRNLDSGKYVAAGPLEAKDDRLGILVVAADSPEAARAIAEADPAVKAGRLTVEMHTWFVAKETWWQ